MYGLLQYEGAMDTETAVSTELSTPASVGASFAGMCPSQPERRVVFIYTLAHPSTGEVRYVGKTDNLKRRAYCHVVDNYQSYKTSWVKSLRKVGLKPKLELLESVDENEWQSAERFWITTLRFYGCRLTNLTAGGEGLVDLIRTAEHCRKISVAAKKRLKSVNARLKISNSLKGHTVSQETRLKISNSLKGQPYPARPKGWVNPLKGRKQTWKRDPISAESRNKIRIALTGMRRPLRSLEHRRKLGNAVKKAHREKLLREFGLGKTTSETLLTPNKK